MSTGNNSNPMLGQQQQQQQQKEQRRRELLDMQALISAELAAYPQSPAGSSEHNSFADYPSIYQQRPQHVSRSRSMAGTPYRNTPFGRNHGGPLEMSRSMSQQSAAAAMPRTKSMGAPPSSIPRTMSNFGRTASRPQPNDGQTNPSVIDAWATQQDDPYTYQPYRQTSQRQPELEQVPELTIGEDPRDYFSRQRDPLQAVLPSNIPTNDFLICPPQHLSSSRRSTFSNSASNTPGSTTLSTGTTLASEMSRQSSTYDTLQSLQMMNVHSNNSMSSELSSTDFSGSVQYYLSPVPKQVSSSEEQNLLLAGAGGASYSQQAPFSFFSPQNAPSTMFDSSIPHVEYMQRTESNDSNMSTSSTKSRSREQLQKQNQLATNRKLAPKAGSDDEKAPPLLRIKSTDGSEDKMVAAIPKTPYQRPKHDRLFCQYCDDREGFRGAHELGRHVDRQHKDMVKKWVCIEPIDGVKREFKPANALAKCKACSQQKKKYGAYYNAAAHLRRAHFVPKPRSRGKAGRADAKLERRGGKGGGDWPPMAELKRWMKEVYEKADSVQHAEEEEEADEDVHGEVDEEASNVPAYNGGMPFDNSLYYATDAQMLDYSPAVQSLGMDVGMRLGLQFEHPLQQQGFEPLLFPPGREAIDALDPSFLLSDELSFMDMHHALTPVHHLQHFADNAELGADNLFFAYEAAATM